MFQILFQNMSAISKQLSAATSSSGSSTTKDQILGDQLIAIDGIDGEDALPEFGTVFTPTPTSAVNLGGAGVTGTLPLVHGGSGADLSGTGGSNQLVKQNTSGGNFTVGTIATSNLSDGTNVALLNANNHFTGTGNQIFDGNVEPATTQMFSWNSKSFDTVYQAASDGLVLAYGTLTASHAVDLTGLTDSSNPPTTTRAVAFMANTGTGTAISLMMPVRKGDYYEVSQNGAGTGTSMWWIPLGTAG